MSLMLFDVVYSKPKTIFNEETNKKTRNDGHKTQESTTNIKNEKELKKKHVFQREIET
jgi:hypothetical protein